MCPPNPPKSGLSALSLLADGKPENWLSILSRAAAESKPQSGLINALMPAPRPATNGLGALSLLNAPEPNNYLATLLGATPASLANALALPVVPPAPMQWIYLTRRFTAFQSNLAYTASQVATGERQLTGVIACLNRHYYGHNSETANATTIGSWGKGTRVRPPRDADLLFLLPGSLYWQYQERTGNKQSQLLQEVRNVLLERYPSTEVKGDGQVVVVPFTPPVEVAPAFACEDGSIIICDANNNGFYKTSTAPAELADLDYWDRYYNGNVRALVRMMKCWQAEKNVPLKSFVIERLAIEFLKVWSYSFNGVFWHDWMVRDFFAYLIGRANGSLVMPGTGEAVYLGQEWLIRAQKAYSKAVSACNNERDNYEALAGSDWQDIFGTLVPIDRDMMEPSAALIDACFRQSENCAYTATSFTIWLRLLRWTRTQCNVSPVVFGGLATWKIVGQTSPTWAAVFTFLASILPLAYRAMKIDQSIADYTTATGEYTNLRDRFRMGAELDGQKPLAEFQTAVMPLFDRLEKIRANPLTPPEWCFKVARRKHKAGHYVHDYDVPRTT